MPRIPIPLVGPSSHARSVAQQSARTVNLFPILNDADAKATIALHHVPGTLEVVDASDAVAGATSIRGRVRLGERLFFVTGNALVEAVDLDSSNLITWGTLPTASGRVGMSVNNTYVIVGDDLGFYLLNTMTGVFSTLLDEADEPILGMFSAYIAGVTIYLTRNADKFFYSAINDPSTVSGLDFATAEGNPDVAKQVLVSNNEIIFPGGRSTEFWAFTGGADNAIERIPGGYISTGIASRHSAVEYGDSVMFVSRNEYGEGSVIRLGHAGSAMVKVSTPAVDSAIAGVLQDGLVNDITAFRQIDNGSDFYILNLPATTGLANGNRRAQPSQTWAWDATSNQWHERAWLNQETGLLERIKADHSIFWRDGGFDKQLVFHYDSATISWQNLDFYSDSGVPIVKLRESAGPINVGGQRFRVMSLGIELEVATGRDGGVFGSDPQLMLQYRWGFGSWSNEIWRPIGKIGEGRRTVRFGPCGSGQDFTVRVSCSDPVRFVLTGGWADVEVGR